MLRLAKYLVSFLLIAVICTAPGFSAPISRSSAYASPASTVSGAVFLSSTATKENAADSMRIRKTEGDVSVTGKAGAAIAPRERMLLYDGYGVSTLSRSYAWIDLDRVKLIKLDENSGAGVSKSGGSLEITLNSGRLFFNIAEPLGEDESLNIRTSNMAIAIRGTCGWVEVVSDTEAVVSILEGTVSVTVTDLMTGEVKIGSVTAGETVTCVVYGPKKPGDKCDIIRSRFTEDDVDGFVLVELVGDTALIDKIYTDTVGGVNLRTISKEQAYARLEADQRRSGGVGAPYYGGPTYPGISYGKSPGVAAGAAPSPWVGSQVSPQAEPSQGLSPAPSVAPTPDPIATPTPFPSVAPSVSPSVAPSASPSAVPSAPTVAPTTDPGLPPPSSPPPSSPPPAALTLAEIQRRLDNGEDVTVPDAFTVGGALAVPVGRTLTFNDSVMLTAAGNVTVDGTMSVSGDVTNSGRLSVSSPNSLYVGGTLDTVSGELTVFSTGKAKIGTLKGSVRLMPGAVLLCKGYDATPDVMTGEGENLYEPGWTDAGGGYSQLSYTVWKLDGGELSVLRIGTSGSDPSAAPWYADRDSVTSLAIGYGVTQTKPAEFQGYANLTKVILPDSLAKISAQTFSGCVSLSDISLPEGLSEIDRAAFSSCTGLAGIAVPGSVKSIGNSAFAGCSSLASVTIADGVESIGSFAFNACGSLGGIAIPNSVTTIGGSAFQNCDSIKSVAIPGNVKSVGQAAFLSCDRLADVTIADGVESVGSSAFSRCMSLDSISIPGSVTSIDRSVFSDCSSLTSVAISEGVESIGDSAFSNCYSLESIAIPGSVAMIGDYAFYKCALTDVSLPYGVKSIGSTAFQSCGSLRSISIPGSVTSIGDFALSYCSALSSVTLPDSVTSIDDGLFYKCSGLDSVTILGSVTSIGSNVFGECTSLRSISYSGAMASWEELSGFANVPVGVDVICSDGTITVAPAVGAAIAEPTDSMPEAEPGEAPADSGEPALEEQRAT